MELANTIEAILFYQAEPMTVKRLSSLLKQEEGGVRDALKVLEEKLLASGLRLITNGDEVVLGTSPDASAVIEAITKEELSKELTKSSLETLAIVLYKGPITRAEIDYIRGVNSTFILRNLLIRGLVEKIENPNDQRSFLYKSTFQLLEHMGVTRIEDLPAYHDTLATLAGFVATKEVLEEEVSAPAEKVSDPEAQEVPEDNTDLEADIVEEDEALNNFDDAQLQEHRKEDEIGL